MNHLIGRPLLPVGVIPITSAVTEIEYGVAESARVTFQDGRTEAVPTERIGAFISETENPENHKGVARVRLELPAMDRYRGIRFVDTPGLDSVFEHCVKPGKSVHRFHRYVQSDVPISFRAGCSLY